MPYTGGIIFTLICCKIVIFVLKRLKINRKEAGFGPFLKDNIYANYITLSVKK